MPPKKSKKRSKTKRKEQELSIFDDFESKELYDEEEKMQFNGP